MRRFHNALGPLIVIVLVTGITQLTQLELYDQQRLVLQGGKGSQQLFDSVRARASVLPTSPPNCKPGEEENGNPPPSSAAVPALLSSFVLQSMCYMDEVFHVPQILRVAVLDNISYYDPMLTTPPGSYVAPIIALHLIKPVWDGERGRTSNAADALLSDSSEGFARRVTQQWTQGHVCDLVGARVEEQVPTWLGRWLGAAWQSSCGIVHAWASVLDEASVSLLGTSIKSAFWPSSFGSLVHFIRKFGSTLHALFWSMCIVVVTLKSPQHSGSDAGWRAALCATAPPLLFSSVLVYTDTTSALVEATLLLLAPSGLDRPTWGTFKTMVAVAIVGGFGVLVRQTNIVWLFFVSARYLGEQFVALCIRRNVRLFDVLKAVAVLLPNALVAAAFVAFMFMNGGIVLGDKTSHEAVFHPAQLAYLGATCAVFFPFQTLHALHQQVWRRRRIFAALGFVAASWWSLTHAVWFHPYLIADNRHYTNVVYRKVLQHDILRVACLVPLSAAGWILLLDMVVGTAALGDARITAALCASPQLAQIDDVSKRQAIASGVVAIHFWTRVVDVVLLLFCAVISCVPQKLLELRYFVPVIIAAWMPTPHRKELWRLPSDFRRATKSRILDVMVGVTIHTATCLVFLYRTFQAPDGSVGRFMW